VRIVVASKRWSGFRSVLCPIDFSEQSRLALRYAASIALRGNGRLRVAFVNDPLLVAAAAAALHNRQQLATLSATELQAFIADTLSDDARARLRVTPHTSTGNPADEIMKTAARSGSDLIVVGTRGLTGPGRIFMGSTTLGVLQRATVPVLAVPSADATAGTIVSPSWPGDRILAPIELDVDSGGDVDVAVGIAEWFDASLVLLHVVDEIAAPAWIKGDVSGHDRIRIAQATARIDEWAAHARRRVKAETRVVCGKVAEEVAALAATERVHLVATALRERHAWFGARRGSVSYEVLSHAVAPVLACPPRWRPR
jgi:nucleotide-binding universal stress UspA family protein